MTYFDFVSAIVAAVEFNALPYLAASVVAVAATGAVLIAHGSRAVSDFRLAWNVNR